MAVAGEERHCLWAVFAVAVGLAFFLYLIIMVVLSCFRCDYPCVVIGYFGICDYRSYWNNYMILVIWSCHMHRYEQVCNDYMNLAWGLRWEGSRNTKPCIFPCKVAAADEERYLLYVAVRLRFVYLFLCRIVMVASSCFGCISACVVKGYFWKL